MLSKCVRKNKQDRLVAATHVMASRSALLPHLCIPMLALCTVSITAVFAREITPHYPDSMNGESKNSSINDKSSNANMVVTATGFKQQQREAPATISVIDQQALTLQIHRNAGEVINNIPGVAVTNGASDIISGDIMIRGMNSEYTTYMVNNVKQNTGESRPYGQDIGAEINFMPPLSAIEHIEVIRGPMSSLYGSDAIGGVVNVITKKPYGLQNWTGAIASNLYVQQHSVFANTNQLNLFLMGPLLPNVLGVSLAADWSARGDDKRDRYFSKHNKQSVDMTFGLAVNETNLLALNIITGRQKKGRVYGPPWSWVFDRDAMTLTHSGWYAQDSIATKNYFQFEQGRSTYTYPGLKKQHVGSYNLVFNSQTTFSFDSNRLTFGVNITHEELNDRFDVEHKRAPGVEPVTKISRNGWALFAEDGWTLNDVILTASARLDNDQHFGHYFTPKLYGNYALNDHLTIKGGVSSGYKKPELRSNSSEFVTPHGSLPPYPYLTVGNGHLKPESSVNTEAGLYYNQDNLSLDGTLFYTDFKNKIDEQDICISERRQCTVRGYQQAKSVSTFFNVGKASVYGLELNSGWKLTETLKIDINYTFNHSEQKTGNYKGYALNDFPKHMANLSLNWSVTPDLNFWGQVNYRSANRLSSAGNRYQAYTLINIGASYQLNHHIKLLASVANLLDEDPHRTSRWGQYGLVEGRHYNLGIRAEF